MADYIPVNASKKMDWIRNFNTWVAAHGTAHGISTAEAAELDTRTDTATTAFMENVAARGAARAATAQKNDRINEVVTLIRNLGQRIQNARNTTDQDRGEAGLTIRDTHTRSSDYEAILIITPPSVHLDFSSRQQVTIHWGHSPQNERRNGRPHGVVGCEIQYHEGGLPDHADDWRPLNTSSESPFVHIIQESTATTYAYRVRYLGRKLIHGPFGAPAVCTVSV